MELGKQLYSEKNINGDDAYVKTLANMLYKFIEDNCEYTILAFAGENVSDIIWDVISTPIREKRKRLL